MKVDLLKKYWFVGVIALMAILFTAYYAVNEQKTKKKTVKTVQKDGKYLIYKSGDDIFTADELYESLYEKVAIANVFSELEKATLNDLYETTSTMQNLASTNAQYVLQKYGESSIDKEMKKAGYNGVKDLSNYYINMQKSILFARDFFNSHKDDLVKPYVEKQGSKVISHILIKVADVKKEKDKDGKTILKANPTEQEKKKLDEVLKALKNDSFSNVAAKYSEDNSAANGGSLGYYDATISKKYVPEFADVANKLKEGEVSSVVLSQFGYHIIKCDATTIDALLKEDSFVGQLRSVHSAKFTTALYQKAKELNYTIVDENIKTKIEKAIEELEKGKTKQR